MKINTRYYEEIEVNEEEKIFFSSGIPGFPNEKEFVILPLGSDSPFSILQSINNEELGFIVAEPFSFYKEYEFNLDESVVSQLSIQDEKDIQVYSIITLGESLSTSTINLQAPVIINRKIKKAKQAILNTETYHTKHPLVNNNKQKGQEG